MLRSNGGKHSLRFCVFLHERAEAYPCQCLHVQARSISILTLDPTLTQHTEARVCVFVHVCVRARVKHPNAGTQQVMAFYKQFRLREHILQIFVTRVEARFNFH